VTAGALCEAERRGANRVILLVHEFVTDRTVDEKHLKNGEDLNRFVERLSAGTKVGLERSTLAGPFTVPGASLLSASLNLYIGKAVRNIRVAG
jgi:hypothetical protein